MAKKKRKKTLSPEEREQRREQLRGKLEAGVEKILDSEEFKRYLKTISNLHDYSWGNILLIMMQDPEATMVAGYAAWQKMGRQVMRRPDDVPAGEWGIKIRVPHFKKKSERDDEDDEERSPAYFAIGTVFDVRQTEGDPLVEPASPTDLTGESDSASAIEKLARAYCAREDVDVREVGFAELGLANGSYTPSKSPRNFIELKRGLTTDQRAKTLVHEIAHHEIAKLTKLENHDAGEIVAEGVAFVVCDHFGLDTSDYSFPYVAGYAEKKEAFKLALKSIQKIAENLVDSLEAYESNANEAKGVA